MEVNNIQLCELMNNNILEDKINPIYKFTNKNPKILKENEIKLTIAEVYIIYIIV